MKIELQLQTMSRLSDLVVHFLLLVQKKVDGKKIHPRENGKGLDSPIPCGERRFQYTEVVMGWKRLQKLPLKESNDVSGTGPGHRSFAFAQDKFRKGKHGKT